MANKVKYANVDFPSGSPIVGERMATNGHYTGEFKGTPMQDVENKHPANYPHYVEGVTVRYGTILQDAIDTNAPAVGVGIIQNLTGVKSSLTSATVKKGADVNITYTKETGYTLPSAITVKVGDTTLTAGDSVYTWTASTGKLVIKAAKVTGDIEVTVTATK